MLFLTPSHVLWRCYNALKLQGYFETASTTET